MATLVLIAVFTAAGYLAAKLGGAVLAKQAGGLLLRRLLKK